MHNKEFLQTDETKERNGNRCEQTIYRKGIPDGK